MTLDVLHGILAEAVTKPCLEAYHIIGIITKKEKAKQMKTNYKKTLAACYLGYITQAITVNLATLFFVIFGRDYGVSYTDLGNLALLTFVIQIAVDASMIK